MDDRLQRCFALLLPVYCRHREEGPSWCGARGMFPPALARFSPAYTLFHLYRTLGTALSDPWRLTFSRTRLVGAVVGSDGFRELPVEITARFMAAGLLASDPMPLDVDQIGFDDGDPALRFSYASMASRLLTSGDVAVLYERHETDHTLRDAAASWRTIGQRAHVIPPAGRGPRGVPFDRACLRGLHAEGKPLVRRVLTRDMPKELKAAVRSLLEAPLPDGWQRSAPKKQSTATSDAPLDASELYRLERASRPAATIGLKADRLAQSLLFPMFTEAELEMLRHAWVAHQRLTTRNKRQLRVPAARLVQELIAGRLGVPRPRVKGWLQRARDTSAA